MTDEAKVHDGMRQQEWVSISWERAEAEEEKMTEEKEKWEG